MPDGRNANMVTSQRLADMGNAATFYHALVDLPKAPEPIRAPAQCDRYGVHGPSGVLYAPFLVTASAPAAERRL